MPRQRRQRNWAKLKQDFLNSEYDTVEEYFRHLEGTPEARAKNGSIARNTKGWAEEKQKLREQASNLAREETLKQATKDLILPTEFFLKGKKEILNITMAKLKHFQDLIKKNQTDQVDTKELETLLKIYKTELAEPSTISHNENQNHNTNEEITIDIEDEEEDEAQSQA